MAMGASVARVRRRQRGHLQLNRCLCVLEALGRARAKVVGERGRAQRAARREEGVLGVGEGAHRLDDLLEEARHADELLAVRLMNEHRGARRVVGR
eukprot:1242356-Prymnesium_polylepis.1